MIRAIAALVVVVGLACACEGRTPSVRRGALEDAEASKLAPREDPARPPPPPTTTTTTTPDAGSAAAAAGDAGPAATTKKKPGPPVTL